MILNQLQTMVFTQMESRRNVIKYRNKILINFAGFRTILNFISRRKSEFYTEIRIIDDFHMILLVNNCIRLSYNCKNEELVI